MIKGLRFLATTFLIGSSYASIMSPNQFEDKLKGDSREAIRTLYNTPMSDEDQSEVIGTRGAGEYFRAFEEFVGKVIKEADEQKDDNLVDMLSVLGCYKFDGTAYKTIIDIALYNRHVNQLVQTPEFQKMVEKAREERRLEAPIEHFERKNKNTIADEFSSDGEESASDDYKSVENKSSISYLSRKEIEDNYKRNIKNANLNARLKSKKKNSSSTKSVIDKDTTKEKRERKQSLIKSEIFLPNKSQISFIDSSWKEQSEIVKNFNKPNVFNEKIEYIKSLNDNDFKNLISTDDYLNISKTLLKQGQEEFDNAVRKKLTQLINKTSESDLRDFLDSIKKSVLKLLNLELINDKSKQKIVEQMRKEKRSKILTKSMIIG